MACDPEDPTSSRRVRKERLERRAAPREAVTRKSSPVADPQEPFLRGSLLVRCLSF